MKSPRSVTFTENDPTTVDHYRVTAYDASTGAQVASVNYPIAGTVTVAPIGSDGFLSSVTDGTSINLTVTEIGPGNASSGPEQPVPGGPYVVSTLPDGAEAITVQV